MRNTHEIGLLRASLTAQRRMLLGKIAYERDWLERCLLAEPLLVPMFVTGSESLTRLVSDLAVTEVKLQLLDWFEEGPDEDRGPGNSAEGQTRPAAGDTEPGSAGLGRDPDGE